jgi:hypothetical protein
MGSLDKQSYRRESRRELQSPLGYMRIQTWTAPLAANATLFTSAASMAAGGTLTTFSAQPVHPRNVQIVASGATTANVTINGTDIRGNAIAETLALNGTTPVLGSKAFANVTSVVLPTVAATTINIGTGTKLGLDRAMYGATAFQALVDNAADSALPTQAFSTTYGAISSNTVIMATAPNGTHNYSIAYLTKELTTAKQTTA